MMQNTSSLIKISLLISGVCFLSLLLYTPSINSDFVNWDDNIYILKNHLIRDFSLSGIIEIFSNFYSLNYQPITLLSYTIEHHLFGLNASIYHFNNIILHIANMILVFCFVYMLLRNTINASKYKQYALSIAVLCFFLFGIHTFHVESIGWISSRKTLLYVFFFLSGLICYIYYISSQNIKKANIAYLLSLLFLILSLLSKGLAISFPVILLSIDFLYKRKILSRKIIIEKLPFFSISILFILLGYFAIHSEEYSNPIQNYLIHKRFLYACYAYTQYILKLLIPINLSAAYHFPRESSEAVPLFVWICLTPIIGTITYFIFSIKRFPIVAFAIFFFTTNLFVPLQIFFPYHEFIMADRYAYLPSIGFYILLSYGIIHLLKKDVVNRIISIIIISLILFYSILSYKRIDVWKNNLSLFNDIADKTPTAKLAIIYRGYAKYQTEDYEGAIADFNEGAILFPEFIDLYFYRGKSYKNIGINNLALKDFNKTISLSPKSHSAYFERSILFIKEKLYIKAIFDLNKAIQYFPNSAKYYNFRGYSFAMQGNHKSAIVDFNTCIQLNNQYKDAYLNLGNSYQALNDFNQAMHYYKLSSKFDVDNPILFYNIAIINYKTRNYNNALKNYNKAIQLKPNYKDAIFNRAVTKLILNDTTGACNDWHSASKLNHKQSIFYFNKYCK